MCSPTPVRVADKAKKAAREEKWAKEAAEREEEEAKKKRKKGKKGEKADGNVGALGDASKSESKNQRFRRIEQERSAKKESQRAEEGAAVDELQAGQWARCTLMAYEGALVCAKAGRDPMVSAETFELAAQMVLQLLTLQETVETKALNTNVLYTP